MPAINCTSGVISSITAFTMLNATEALHSTHIVCGHVPLMLRAIMASSSNLIESCKVCHLLILALLYRIYVYIHTPVVPCHQDAMSHAATSLAVTSPVSGHSPNPYSELKPVGHHAHACLQGDIASVRSTSGDEVAAAEQRMQRAQAELQRLQRCARPSYTRALLQNTMCSV